MKTRVITGACYIAVLAAFYLLKIFVNDLFFDCLIWAFSLIGTFEILRALKDKTTSAQKTIVFAFAAVCIPACALAEEFAGYGIQAVFACFIAFSVALLALLVAKHGETTPENLGTTFLTGIYPTLMLTLLSLSNHLSAGENSSLSAIAFNSDLAILFVFVISPVADSLAYEFGRRLKGRFPKKMAPELSPNKTVVGGIGGLIGGILGAAILYFAYNAVAGSYDDMAIWLLVYLFIGLLSAIATEFGDLVESCIKRKANIKDMGKLMPGHGGILDRIDGTLFATVVVYLSFIIIYSVV